MRLMFFLWVLASEGMRCVHIYIYRHISRRFKVILRPLLPLQEGRSTPGRWCGKETWLDQGRSMLSLVGRVDANVIYGEM